MTFADVRDKDKQGDYNTNRSWAKREERAAYREDEARLTAQFLADLRLAFETELGQPIADEAWKSIGALAWQEGHSFGLYEVITWAEDLLPIAQGLLRKEEVTP